MNKRFPSVAAFILAVSVIFSGCSSDESPSELDMLIEQLQTVHMTSETIPEEVSDDAPVSENTDEQVTAEPADGTSEEVTENTDASENNDPITYNSITVTVLSIADGRISVEYNGVVYSIIIDENTNIFGGDISEEKTVTITYILNDDDSGTDIFATAITVLP